MCYLSIDRQAFESTSVTLTVQDTVHASSWKTIGINSHTAGAEEELVESKVSQIPQTKITWNLLSPSGIHSKSNNSPHPHSQQHLQQ